MPNENVENLSGLRLSSGSTMLNLACTGNPNFAMVTGRYYWLVGDSSSGKTFLTLTFLAEASINKAFDGYDLIFDDVEGGALMDVEQYFGPKLAERLQPPLMKDGEPVYSRTVEEFYFNLDDRLELARKKGRPFVYLLDSMDALDSDYAEKKFQEKKTAARKGKEAKGDYGDGKAKINSTHIRRVNNDLRDTGSILIILSQTRDNISAGLFDPKQTSAGGRALKFYAGWQLWSSISSVIKRTVHDKERQVGIVSKIRIRKNRLTGKEWDTKVPIYWSMGIDDLGSCVDYLIEEKHWSADKSGKITAPELDFAGHRNLLIEKIEEECLEVDLRAVVVGVWQAVVEQCAIHRKSKYH